MPERYASVIDVHVILDRDGKVLLLRRAGNVYASGQLCLPSGHLEHGETIMDAAVREVREETGIILDPAAMRLVLTIHRRNPGTTHARIGFAFQPRAWHVEPANLEPDKCSELIWADPGDLPAGTTGYTEAIMHAVARRSRSTAGDALRASHAVRDQACVPVGERKVSRVRASRSGSGADSVPARAGRDPVGLRGTLFPGGSVGRSTLLSDARPSLQAVMRCRDGDSAACR